jgi:hypothetical protein
MRSGERNPVASVHDHYLFGDLASGRIFVAHIEDLDGSGVAPFETLRLLNAASETEQSLLWIVGGGIPAPRADLRFGRDDDGSVDWDGAGVGGSDPQCNGNPLTPGERGRTCGLGLELPAIVLTIRRLRRYRRASA